MKQPLLSDAQASLDFSFEEDISPDPDLAMETAAAVTFIEPKHVPLAESFSLDPAIGQLLKAYGATGDCLALQSVNRWFLAMSEAVVKDLKLSGISKWVQVADRLERNITQIMTNPALGKERSALGSPVSDSNFDGMYRTLVMLAEIGNDLAPHVRQNLDRLTVTLVLSAASQNQRLPDTIGDGLRQCYQCLAEQRTNRWSSVAKSAPIDCDAIAKLIVPNSSGVVDEFLRICHALLAAEMEAPPESSEVGQNVTAAQGSDLDATAKAHATTNSKSAADEKFTGPDQNGKAERVPHEVVAPTIAAFVRAAQITNLATKAGVPYQWDCLILDDLAELTEKLAANVDHPDDELSALATLALASLCFRTNAKSALLIPTEYAPYAGDVDLRANISRSCMMWTQAAYTQAARPDVPLDSPEDLTVINEIPFSEVLARGLGRHLKASGPQIDLAGILSHPFGISGISLKIYNKFLADLGDNAHIAEPTRFANSNGLAFLEVTGSDMLTAQCSLHFEMAGPAALYYFSPSANHVQEQCTKVYQRLHLGNAVWLDDRPARTGPRKVPDSTVVKVGWNELCDDLIETYESVCEWKDDIQGAAAFNELVPMCASAFTIGCAGRGSEPQRVNEAAVLPGGGNFVLDDKLTDGPRSARILPHTEVTAAAIKILRSARSIVCSRLGLSTGETSAATQSLFSTLKDSNHGEAPDQSIEYEWVAIEASDLTAIAKRYFNADLNFQRHLWVTDLGECLVDRWLTRAFTGHGSHLLNTFAASMNVAPVEAMQYLRDALESRMGPVLGDSGKLKALADQIEVPAMASMPMNLVVALKPHTKNECVSADPLPPIDRQCLIDWNLVNNIRCALAQNKIGASIDVQILLSMLAHSGIQEIENALDFSTNSDGYRHIGNANGVSWSRQHYVHDLFLPLQKPTVALLLLRAEKTPSTRKLLTEDAAGWLRSIPGFFGWPTNDFETLKRFSLACERWRRLELPPSICTMASPVIETACLSPLSLYRLSKGGNEVPGAIGQIAQRFASKRMPIEKNHGLARITTALNKFAKTSEGLGGQLARAQALKRELEGLGNSGTAIFTFSRDMLVLECDAIISHQPYRNKISTLAHRWTSLHPVLNAYPRDVDFGDFEEDELVAFVDLVNTFCLTAMQDDDKRYVTGEGKERSERARDSLQRLFHMLSRDGWEIPSVAWKAIGGATVRVPRLSASSTLIFPNNIREISRAEMAVFINEAPLATRLTVKTESMYCIPMRIGEASCPPMQCITKSGAMAICKTPFTVDKSPRTSRVWPLPKRVADIVKELSNFNTEVCPDGKWLYRFDPQSTSDDVRINDALAALIRWATGDDDGRPHSLRANAYMSIFWPGWQEILQKFLTGKLDAFTCRAWTHASSLASRWTQAIRSMASAGHGAVDPGFEHYCSIWPLIYCMHLQATLADSQPTVDWLVRLDIKPNTMQQARKRHGAQPFDLWNWMVDSKPLDFSKKMYEPRDSLSDPLPPRIAGGGVPHQSAAVVYPMCILYMCCRGLGMSPGKAGHASGVFGGLQDELNLYLPGKDEVDSARRRKKSHSDGAALASDIELTCGDSGQKIIGWVASLDTTTFSKLDATLRRAKEDVPEGWGQVRLKSFWESVIKDIPQDFCLCARFGRGDHLKPTEEVALRNLNPGFQIRDRHRDLGAMPEVMLSSRTSANDVTSRRFTAILKLAFVARKSVERLEIARAQRLYKDRSGQKTDGLDQPITKEKLQCVNLPGSV